jgi:RNA polymerase sigma-70 factor (ECF subfamily)
LRIEKDINETHFLEALKRGESHAVDYFFNRYAKQLYAFSFKFLKTDADAEEIVQELFYVLWKDRDKLQILHSVKSYLYGAIRNQSLQYCEHVNVRERYKEHQLNAEEQVPDSTPEEMLEYKELEEVINRTLKKLPQRRQAIFRMHRLEGLKYKEIADTLSLSVKTIEAEMTKTYQELRREIERYTYVL